MKKILFFLLILSFSNCKNKQERTKFLLPRNQFKEVLQELHRYEGKYNIRVFREDSLHEEEMVRYDSLFAANNVSRKEFFRDYDAYIQNQPHELDTMYQEIVDELELIRDSLQMARRNVDTTKQLTDSADTRVQKKNLSANEQ